MDNYKDIIKAELRRNDVSIPKLAKELEMAESTIRALTTKDGGRIDSLEKVLNYFGYELKAVSKYEMQALDIFRKTLTKRKAGKWNGYPKS